MGFIPDQDPSTGPFSIEARSSSVQVYAEGDAMSVHGTSGEGTVFEVNDEHLGHVRACLDQALWVRMGRRGDTFEGVPVGFEVIRSARKGMAPPEVLARVGTEEQAEAALDLARQTWPEDAWQFQIRPLPYQLSPALWEARQRLEAATLEARLAEEDRVRRIVTDALGDDTPVSFVIVAPGDQVGSFIMTKVAAYDRERDAFRGEGDRDWHEIGAVRFLEAGISERLQAAFENIGEDKSIAGLAAILAGERS